MSRAPSLNLSPTLLLLLWAGILTCGLTTLGQETSGNPRLANLDDEGVFEISLAGRATSYEKFKIHSSPDKVVARAEIQLHLEQNGKTVSVQTSTDFVLDPQLRPMTYTWIQKGPQSSRLQMDFRGQLAKVHYQTVSGADDDRGFGLPRDVVILDDNVVHHYQLIIYRYQALGGGKQAFHAFVPQEALPGLLTVEDKGEAATTIRGITTNLRHLVITTDQTHIDLWVDNQQHLERVSLPEAQLEAIRKK